jgi:hypothetical protein
MSLESLYKIVSKEGFVESTEIPQELVDILDARAGKIHSRTGVVLTTLAEILTKYDEMRNDGTDSGDL